MKKFLMKMPFGLQMKSTILIVLLFFIPYSFLGWFFYSKQYQATTNQVALSDYNTINQIGMNVEHLLKDVKKTSLIFFQNNSIRNFLMAESPETILQSSRDLNAFLTNLLAYDLNIAGVSICRLDGIQYHTSSNYPDISKERIAEILLQTGRFTYMGEQKSLFSKGETAYVFSRKLNDTNDLGVALGVVQIYVGIDKVQGLFNSASISSNSSYYIMDNNLHEVIYSETDRDKQLYQDFLQSVQRLPNDKSGYYFEKIHDKKKLITYYRLPISPNWVIVRHLSNYIAGQSIKTIFFFSILLGVIVCICFSFWLSTQVFIRLKLIANAMKEVEYERFELIVPETGNDEITALTQSFNQMNNKLNELVNQVYASKIREKDAEIKSLRAYINPHFFFNTLDTICWMSREENAYETCALVEALSKIFRQSITTEKRITSVAEELEYTREYLKIQECRYSDKIDFIIHEEPGLSGYATVSSIIQPLVENAIIHGLEPSKENGNIVISIYSDDEHLYFSVENDGVDVDISQLYALLASYKEGRKGMALYGVNSRIQLHYGAEYGLRFYPHSPHGLRAVIEQPLLEGQNPS